ncbi:class E sortase [Streptomyces sp. NBC_00178]|uniref:class E sortase n=1 Tax=Streptomyces sp. NBC_00178 TaxID=2975672 RepID=UPI002E27C010|nr:class E sortase [Streptomyces sp. NBC_00178]
MTSFRPDSGQEGSYARGAYEPDGTFEAAVEQLADPLNDPLPEQHASNWPRPETAGADEEPPGASETPRTAPRTPVETPGEWYDPEGYQRDWYGQQRPGTGPTAGPAEGTAVLPGLATAVAEPSRDTAEKPAAPSSPRRPAPGRAGVPPQARPAGGDETIALRTADIRRAQGPEATDSAAATDSATAAATAVSDGTTATGGRAERRRAAKGRGRRRPEPGPPAASGTAASGAPMSRVEARRAARAAKESPAVVASRVVGEVFITFGVLMLLFVTYQLWWTNVRADQIAGRETHKIQDDWASGERSPGAFEPGQGFAIMHIPKLDVVAPIAEGISKEKVLDRGMVGHYGEGKLKTAMPSAKQGNFAVAGHRNTHGEPFRYINKLKPGDPIVVETQEAYYTYEMTSILPQTSPSNVAVIDEVPPGSGFTGPGRYITLTTCTPEFTSTYRMIVWGKMVDERPRSKGKPDALVG